MFHWTMMGGASHVFEQLICKGQADLESKRWQESYGPVTQVTPPLAREHWKNKSRTLNSSKPKKTYLTYLVTIYCVSETGIPTVDGSEIRRSPVEVGSLSHYLPGFSTIQTVVSRISEPSTAPTSPWVLLPLTEPWGKKSVRMKLFPLDQMQ